MKPNISHVCNKSSIMTVNPQNVVKMLRHAMHLQIMTWSWGFQDLISRGAQDERKHLANRMNQQTFTGALPDKYLEKSPTNEMYFCDRQLHLLDREQNYPFDKSKWIIVSLKSTNFHRGPATRISLRKIPSLANKMQFSDQQLHFHCEQNHPFDESNDLKHLFFRWHGNTPLFENYFVN